MIVHHRHLPNCLVLPLVLALGSGCGRKAGTSSDGDVPRPVQDLPQGLVIPEGSSMRARVKVEAIAPRPVRHELNVPATAEADPAKMAKISPPLPGRVVTPMAYTFGYALTGAVLVALALIPGLALFSFRKPAGGVVRNRKEHHGTQSHSGPL